MKRTYKTPKALLVDFCYDEQVTAASGGTALHGDPQHIGRCQQGSEIDCMVFWTSDYDGKCTQEPYSIPGFPVVI